MQVIYRFIFEKIAKSHKFEVIQECILKEISGQRYASKTMQSQM